MYLDTNTSTPLLVSFGCQQTTLNRLTGNFLVVVPRQTCGTKRTGREYKSAVIVPERRYRETIEVAKETSCILNFGVPS